MFDPKYTITSRMLNDLSESAEIKAKVESAKLLPAREIFLKQTAAVKMAHTSTSIEGNQLAEYQVKQVAEGKEVRAAKDQITEVRNYLLALKKIDEMAASSDNISLNDILKIHKIVTKGLVEEDKCGKIRPGDVFILNLMPDGTEQIGFTPPKSDRVKPLLEELLDWLANEKEVHPVIKAGLFHYEYVTIHPFTDGNGRSARLLTLLILYKLGWDFKKSLVLEDYYNKDRPLYYECLNTGENYDDRIGKDLTGWLSYFVEGFAFEAKRLNEEVLSLRGKGDDNKPNQVLDGDELKIVDFAVSVGQLTSSDVVDILGIPKRTAQAKLKKLEDKKIIKKLGSGPSTYYEIIEV